MKKMYMVYDNFGDEDNGCVTLGIFSDRKLAERIVKDNKNYYDGTWKILELKVDEFDEQCIQ